MSYYKCQLCGSERSMLEQDLRAGTMICYDRELCAAAQEFDKEFDDA